MQIILLLIPFFATIIFILLLQPVALKIGLIDHPVGRKQHKTPTPLVGGLAIFLALLLTLSLINVQFPNQIAFISAITLLVFVGAIDDYKHLSVKTRLAAQIVASLIMTEVADIKINDLGDLFLSGNINLGIFASAFTVFAVVGGINAFNMIDGLDGLCGGLTFASIMSIAVVAWLFEQPALLDFCLIVMATNFAFLLFNLRIFGRTSAKIFLGDAGSTLLGFTICWLAIYGSQIEHRIITPTVVLWIIALPVMDSVCIMLRRVIRGYSPFSADREHLHHILLLADYSVNQTVSIIILYDLILTTVGIIASFLFNVPDAVLFILFLILFGIYYSKVLHDQRKRDRRVAERRVPPPILEGRERRIQEKRRTNSDRRYTQKKK